MFRTRAQVCGPRYLRTAYDSGLGLASASKGGHGEPWQNQGGVKGAWWWFGEPPAAALSDSFEDRRLVALLAESWTAAERKVARASSERSLASTAGSDARKRMPAGAAKLREVGEHGGDAGAGDGDEGEQLPPSSLHSQHAATSLLCGEGVLVPGGVVVIEV